MIRGTKQEHIIGRYTTGNKVSTRLPWLITDLPFHSL